MDIKQFNEMQIKLQTLENSISNINQKLSAMEIDNQFYIKKNKSIKPSISSKVTFDENGIIIDSQDLEESDIPTLSIDKIKSLRRELSKKIDKSELLKIIDDKIKDYNFTPGEIINTGIKINYDKHGLIVDSANNLIPEDIPNLSIDKIDNLSNELNHIKSLIDSINYEKNTTSESVQQSQHTDYEKMIKNMELRIITHINNFESKLQKFASKDSVQNVVKLINQFDTNQKNDFDTKSKNNSDNKIDMNNILNRISNIEKSIQSIMNQFNKISELIKLNKRIDDLESKISKYIDSK